MASKTKKKSVKNKTKSKISLKHSHKKVSPKILISNTKKPITKKPILKKSKKTTKTAKKIAKPSKKSVPKLPFKPVLNPSSNFVIRPATEKFEPSEEQGILTDETEEQIEDDMRVGKKDEDIYEEPGQELLEEDDEIEPWEQGFMQGATKAGQLSKDALTGEPLKARDIIELRINGKLYRFNTIDNAIKFKQKFQKT
jgi:hypothetical protein